MFLIKNLKINLCIILLFIINAFTLSYIGIIVGNIIESLSIHNFNEFIYNISTFITIIILNIFSSYISWNLVYRLGYKFVISIKDDLYKRDIRKKINTEINIANYTTNMDSIYSKYFLAKYSLINLIFTMSFSILSILYINFKMLIVAFFAASLPMISTFIFRNKIEKKSILFNSSYNNYQKYISERLSKRLEFDNYNIFEKVYKEKSEIEKKNEKRKINLMNIGLISSIFSKSMGSISYIIIFLFGAKLLFEKELSIGSIVSVIQLMNYLVDPIISIAQILNDKKEAEPLLKDIYNITKFPIEEKNEINFSNPIKLEVRNLTYKVNDRKIIDGFSFSFRENGKYLIKGESGVGKSTLAQIISGLLIPNSGEVLINNQNIQSFKRQNYICYVNQNPILINSTLGNNIKFYRKLDNSIVELMIKKINIKRSIDEYINDATGLSGGERMKINILRSMVDKKDIIIYDEPTAAIDNKESIKIMSEILKQEGIIIVISHKLNHDIIKQFDEVIEI